MEPEQQEVKCAIIGDKGVGKSSLLDRCSAGGGLNSAGPCEIIWKHSDIEYHITIQELSLDEPAEIIDEGGFSVLVLVYDTTARSSLLKLEQIVKQMKESQCLEGKIIVVVGNKRDQYKKEVKKQDGSNFAKDLGYFMEASAKDSINI